MRRRVTDEMRQWLRDAVTDEPQDAAGAALLKALDTAAAGCDESLDIIEQCSNEVRDAVYQYTPAADCDALLDIMDRCRDEVHEAVYQLRTLRLGGGV